MRKKKNRIDCKEKPIGERPPLPGDPFAAYILAFNEAHKRGEYISYGKWEVKNYGNH